MKNFVCKIPMLIIALTFIGCGGLDYNPCGKEERLQQVHNKIQISLVSYYTNKNKGPINKLGGPGTCGAGERNYKKFAQCILEMYDDRLERDDLEELKNFITQVDKIPLEYRVRLENETKPSSLNCSVMGMGAYYENNASIIYGKGNTIVEFYAPDMYDTDSKLEIYPRDDFKSVIENIHNDIIAYNSGSGLWINGKKQGQCKDGKHKYKHSIYGNYSYACENGLIKNGLIRVVRGEPLTTTTKDYGLTNINEININDIYLYRVIKITDSSVSREIEYYDLTELFKTIIQNADAKLDNSLEADRKAYEKDFNQGRAAYEAVGDFTSGRTKTRPSQATINLASRFEKKYLKGSDKSSQTFEKHQNDRNAQIKSEVAVLEKRLSEDDEYILKLIKTQQPNFTRVCEYKDSKCQISVEELGEFNKHKEVKGWSVK